MGDYIDIGIGIGIDTKMCEYRWFKKSFDGW